ncbi:MAG: PsiF family protein [Steroidobacteraceae bacterium]
MNLLRKTLMTAAIVSFLPAFALAAAPATSPSMSGSTTATATPPARVETAKPASEQQQLMKDCNATAKTKHLKGKDRKDFMRTCLKKS